MKKEHPVIPLSQAVETIKTAILQSQARAAKMISGSQLSLYFGVGLYVSANSREGTWGTGAVHTISEQLHKELPGLRGFSVQNIRNMRQFAEFWQPYLIRSPMASELDTEDLQNKIEYDSFALAKWSPTTSEIYYRESRIHWVWLSLLKIWQSSVQTITLHNHRPNSSITPR